MNTKLHKIIEGEEYLFLRDNVHLGKNIILLGLGGSHGYGTNIETSDVDVRGIAVNSRREILLGNGFDQVIDNKTDTVIYSFKKVVNFLASCNPNVIELLGLLPEHYLYLSEEGKELLENKSMFLSQRAVKSFGGYANQQLRRLFNAVERKDNAEIGQRNLKAIRHKKLAKHSMHLVRLYYMAFDILEKGEINTYREKEHDLLMSIRNGEFLDKEDKPIPAFFELVDELSKRFEYCKNNTSLSVKPNMKRIEDFVINVHEKIISKGEIMND